MEYIGKFGFDNDLVDYEKLVDKAEVVSRVERVANRLYQSTKLELNTKHSIIAKLARELIDKETMTGEEVTEFF